VLVREDVPGDKRLVAYVVPAAGVEPNVAEWRSTLAARLPEYMVPAAFVVLEALPLTSNGKVDRKALPAPEGGREAVATAFEAAQDEVEATLARIWSEVLGVPEVGRHDSFFELGGDSILSIQAISRAAAAGIRLTPRQLFQTPTIAQLAAVAGTSVPVVAEQGEVTGEAPLTPIQRWFFEQALPEPWHWNQATLLESSEPIDAGAMRGAIEAVLRHHDALRLRFARNGDEWTQAHAAPGGETPFERVDLSMVEDASLVGEIERRATAVQASLDLERGPLLRVVLFDAGAARPARLLVAIHHLAIDGVSWRILLEDVQAAYHQLASGAVDGPAGVRLPRKTTSFRHWAERIAEHARSETVTAELDHWTTVAADVRPLPVDLERAPNDEASAASHASALDPETTAALLESVPAVQGLGVQDALLAALALTLGEWAGTDEVVIDLEGHGREDVLDGVDLSRTVGWFTSIYPVRLAPGDAGGPAEALRRVRDQLRAVPTRGIGYGLLRYLGPDAARQRLTAAGLPEVVFNYLGQYDQLIAGGGPFRPARENSGTLRAPSGSRAHLLEVNASAAGGRLHVEWAYGSRVHRAETIERLADRFLAHLRELVEHCRRVGAEGFASADFPELELSAENLDAIFDELYDEAGNS
jgi:non-ribosomal peptide synthase protein (TIGR01720 family)